MTNVSRSNLFQFGVWCGFRVTLLIGLITAVATFTIGAIIAGVALKSWNYDVMCQESPDEYGVNQSFKVSAPLDIVGPAMMSFGSGVLSTILIEWFLLKPISTFIVRE